MNEEESLKYKIALTLLPGIGPVFARLLISYCGGVEEIFRKRKGQLERIPGIGTERAAIIAEHRVFERAEEEVIFIRKHKIQVMFYLDENYPSRLKNCDDAPVILFMKGTCDLNAPRMVAIVGTRNITNYGREVTEQLIAELSSYKITIVSGLAYGVDVLAHKSAIKYGLPTIGVTAHGLDRIYPQVHKPAAENMIRNGGILTEYPSGTIPERDNFPARNRIVAGMCDATIVIESALKGGALITAEFANEYNRDVFAIPGRIGDSFSQGCLELIRQNKATMIGSAEHIIQALNWDVEEDSIRKKNNLKQTQLFHELTPEEKNLVDYLKAHGQTPIDTLAIETGIPVSRVSSTLLNLEFSGFIRSKPGKVYELI